MLIWKNRVEKYRPDTLDDVSGHQDIIATINRFVDSNVRTKRNTQYMELLLKYFA